MNNKYKQYGIAIGICILIWGAVFCGMRGSFQRYPLSVSFAYFCNNPFYNKLGVNPTFNIIKSAGHKNALPVILNGTNMNDALLYMQKEWGMTQIDSLCPIARVISETNPTQKNVVIILLEGMASHYLELTYEGEYVLPYLHSLQDSAIWFKHCYSAGVHTNNGIVASLYGFGPNFAEGMMKNPSDKYAGLPYWLSKNGYQTFFFCTGNPQYDNMNSFLRDNYFDQIISQYDYPKKMIVNNFGVSDDYMLQYGLNYLDSIHANSDAPFLATFLTVSHHAPFVIPKIYQDLFKGNEDAQILRFVDDALARFMHDAQNSSWGKNTIFVLIGDHGYARKVSLYDYALDVNQIVCFMRNGAARHVYDGLMEQIDVFPTIMGQLGFAYVNNSMGQDVLTEPREVAYFVNNEQMACVQRDWLYSCNINSGYRCLYQLGDTQNYIQQDTVRANQMHDMLCKWMFVGLNAVSQKWTEPCDLP